jgi:hypothetical protein
MTQLLWARPRKKPTSLGFKLGRTQYTLVTLV